MKQRADEKKKKRIEKQQQQLRSIFQDGPTHAEQPFVGQERLRVMKKCEKLFVEGCFVEMLEALMKIQRLQLWVAEARQHGFLHAVEALQSKAAPIGQLARKVLAAWAQQLPKKRKAEAE